MADVAEKTVAPTQPRRDDARREGHVAHSHDLAAAALLVLGLLAISWLGERIVAFCGRFAQEHLGSQPWTLYVTGHSASDPLSVAADRGQSLLIEIVLAIAPLLGVLFVAAMVANLAQTGFRWLPERLAPDVGRINPLAGLRRVFSLGGGERLGMALLKLACVLLVAYISLWQQREVIVNAAALELSPLAAWIVEIVYWTCLKIAVALLALAIGDYGYQRWKLERDLRMTPQELREETRNQQGDPQVLSRRKTIQRQQGIDRLVAAVPQAKFVVTFGRQLAVAIAYDPATMPAPRVVAKGAGDVAERICGVADKHGVPSIERRTLAESLYRQIGFNQPISDELFDPVARILAEIYQLNGQSLMRRAA
ncbi:MAG: EscU/YscU/HrcU family type III secretion system export apparatus switch protein [Pirellulales bacterium]|nr:EscU/YscU/HrcU family type III secretion system export apparatus switch protein [Pirellulales bacterium]